ncbi:MAG: DNA polymerase III subunit gamma/tau [Flavobacteriales bacterium]|jgi:DNA polymerase III subunit gamma/tau|nr:DNA polymerase III subunit gamma/tau [Flavobacteriales bacterium]
MSDFIVSARKYRPSTFNAVVGQSSITSTLKNAIKSNQLAQSFLFCGPRGIGKTSCARILAKTINCENITENIEACNECVSCKSFNENASFNVHELDAASNNSVDDIRRLVDQVRFAPQIGEYNIYIIDEVHMLSTQAFNAFLKTLEEPPKHAKFILATTEKHKIIPTILSRCQIFDFKRVGINDISNHLAFVAKSEEITADQEAFHLIAQKSDGSLRDSLSLFDRLISFSEKELTYQGVIAHLNILDYEYYFKVTAALLKNDINTLLLLFNEILDNGFDGHHFIIGLSEHLRDILVAKDESTLQLLEKGETLQQRYLEQSKLSELSFLIRALSLCNECDVQYKESNNKRLLVELSLMRISSIGHQTAEKKSPKSFIVTLNDEKKQISVEKVTEIEKTTESHKKPEIESNSEVADITPKSIPRISLLSKKKSKTISIAAAFKQMNEKKDVEEEMDISKLRSTDFSSTKMLESWKEVISFVKQKGKSNLGITLGVFLPELNDNFVIVLPLSNHSQVEMILEEKYMILEFLRNKLENDYIEITTKVIKGAKNNIPYTNKDKFSKMMKQNPYLETLRMKLGLDPDY